MYTKLCTLFFVTIALNAFSQLHDHLQFTIEDGLPTNYIYGVTEDVEGYIWAYSENGIAKFDGYTWKHYDQDDGLPGIDVHSMMTDSAGCIYGLCFNRKAFILKGDSVITLPEVSPTITGYDGNILVRQDSIGYFNLNAGIDSIVLNDKLFDFYLLERKKLKPLLMSQPFVDSNNQLGFLAINHVNKQLQYYKNGVIKSLKEVPDIELNHLDLKFNGKKMMLSSNKWAYFLDENVEIYDSIYFNIPGYNSANILSSYIDRNNQIWIGTRNEGLLMIPSLNKKIDIVSGSKGEWIESVKSYKESIFFATHSGDVFKYSDGNTELVVTGNSRLADLIILPRGELFISTTNFENIYNCETLKPQQKFFHQEYSSSNNIELESISYVKTKHAFRSIMYDWYHNYYVASGAVHYSISKSKNNWAIKSNLKNIPNLRGLKAKKNGEVFAYGPTGLYFLNPSLIDYSKQLELGDISSCFHLDGESYLIGTRAHGLYLWDKSTLLLTQISKLKEIREIKEVNGQVLIAGLGGVYNYQSDEIKVLISSKEGLPSKYIYDVAYIEPYYFIATNGGLGRIHEDKLDQKDEEYKYISKLELMHEDVAVGATHFSHKENDIELKFQLTHYPSGNKINYKYKLHPLEQEWQYTNATKIRYPNLDPGKYIFEVCGLDIYNESIDIGSVAIEISKAWHQNVFVRILGLLLMLLLVIYVNTAIRKKKEKKVREDSEIQMRMDKLKLTALRSQMNPHFIFNALGAIQYYIQKNEQDLADDYLAKFARLMRQYLDNSKKQFITIREEIELLKNYVELERMRFEGTFHVVFDIASNVNVETQIPSMILQPFVENAINHGLRPREDSKGGLSIAIIQNEKNVCINIIDNGVGMNYSNSIKSKKHKSHAKLIIDEKMEILQKMNLMNIELATYPAYLNAKFPGTKVVIAISSMQSEVSHG